MSHPVRATGGGGNLLEMGWDVAVSWQLRGLRDTYWKMEQIFKTFKILSVDQVTATLTV